MEAETRLRERQAELGEAEQRLRATLAAQAFVSLGFYAFLLLSSNPFTRTIPSTGPKISSW